MLGTILVDKYFGSFGLALFLNERRNGEQQRVSKQNSGWVRNFSVWKMWKLLGQKKCRKTSNLVAHTKHDETCSWKKPSHILSNEFINNGCGIPE